MIIVPAGYEILTPISEGGIKELQHIETIGRVCYKSEDKILSDGSSAKIFVAGLIKRGHEAMIEHSTLAVKFIVDRGVSHEQVRHRIASFAQESTRYCNYTKDKHGAQCAFIDLQAGIDLDPIVSQLPQAKISAILAEWLYAMRDAENHYNKMISLGATPQIARSVLPTSTKTEIIITANYREWRTFFKLRTASTAHPQMREIAIPLLLDLQEILPIIFDDIKIKDR